MKITVCVGSSCHLKGSHQVVERLQELITKNNLKDQVELLGEQKEVQKFYCNASANASWACA